MFYLYTYHLDRSNKSSVIIEAGSREVADRLAEEKGASFYRCRDCGSRLWSSWGDYDDLECAKRVERYREHKAEPIVVTALDRVQLTDEQTEKFIDMIMNLGYRSTKPTEGELKQAAAALLVWGESRLGKEGYKHDCE